GLSGLSATRSDRRGAENTCPGADCRALTSRLCWRVSPSKFWLVRKASTNTSTRYRSSADSDSSICQPPSGEYLAAPVALDRLQIVELPQGAGRQGAEQARAPSDADAADIRR